MLLVQRLYWQFRMWWRRKRSPGYWLKVSDIDPLVEYAHMMNRRPDDVARELIYNCFRERDKQQDVNNRWWTLSDREQQVAALICLGYQTRQIAAQLVIARTTVKSHSENICKKFGVSTREELREILYGWDFTWALPKNGDNSSDNNGEI